MLIESDILIAYIKKQDWLKSTAERIIGDVESGVFDIVQIPRKYSMSSTM